MAKKRPYKPVPPPPGDAANYVLVESKEGPYWRRKRGTVVEATLNATFKKNTTLVAIASPAAKRIQAKLQPFLQEMETGRFIANVSGKLVKAWNKNRRFDYSFMNKYEMQPDRPTHELMPGNHVPNIEKDELMLHIDLARLVVNRLAKSVPGFYLELILLHGDPSKTKALRVESDTSPIYTFQPRPRGTLKLSITLPLKKTPWMALLKVSCMENGQLVKGARYSAMKVVKTGYVLDKN